MKSIIPLEYKIKILKQNVLNSTIEEYKKIEFMKQSIQDYFFFLENQESSKFKPKNILQRKVWLYQEIEIIENKSLFINFKYWDAVIETDNSIIIENDEITQVINPKGDLLADFPCWISFNVIDDWKFLKISWKMTIMVKWNEQMKWKIKEILEKIYIHNNQWENTIKPSIEVEFFYTKDEINIIDKKVRWIKMSFNIENKNLFKQWENWSNKKTARLDINYSWWWKIWIDNEKELEKFINELETNLWNFGILVSKTAQIKDNWKTYSTVIENQKDELIVNLKEAVIESKKEISYTEFKKLSLTFFK